MIAVVARLKVLQGQEKKFEDIMLDLAKQVELHEEGCSLFKVCRTQIPEQYVVLERYKDQKAFDLHQKSEHFKQTIPKLKGVLAGGVEIEELSEI